MTSPHCAPWSNLLLRLVAGLLPWLVLSSQSHAATGQPDYAQAITVNDDGTLTYVPNPRGDMVPDFSAVGWRNGDQPLPGQPGGITVPVVVTLDPGTGDQSSRIQAAIWRVAQLPLDANGFRGAILLKAGTWEINRTLLIDQSGIVLRGEGRDPSGVHTHLIATMITNDGYTGVSQGGSMIRVRGNFDDTPRFTSDATSMVNTSPQTWDIVGRVPVGAKSITVSSIPTLQVGELVRIHRPVTQNWVDDEGLAFNTSAYISAGQNQVAHRRVVSVDGTTIHLNAPITLAIDPTYGGGKVLKVTAEGYIRNVGIENLYATSAYANPMDQNHAWNVVAMERTEDSYVQDVTARYFGYALCYITTTARQISVERCQMIDPVSWVTNGMHESGRRIQDAGGNRYAYLNNGELTLVRDSYSRHSRHEFPTSWFLSAGPAAFVDCLGENGHNESGAHIYWTTGTLWDNVRMESLQNKRERPTGNNVIWNCVLYGGPNIVENAVTAVNWAFGSTTASGGAVTFSASNPPGGVPRNQGGEIFSNGTRMSVRSLHDAQVAARRLAQGLTYTPRTTHQRPALVPILPTITPYDATGKVGTAFSYAVKADPMPIRLSGGTYYTATGLPPGLSITTGNNKTYGYITGTPTTSGDYTVTLVAINQDGSSTPTPVTFTILSSTDSTTFPLSLSLRADYPDGFRYDTMVVTPMTANYDRNGDLDFTNNVDPALDETGVVVPVTVVASHQFPALRIPITVTYNGSATLPTDPGSYTVTATSTNPLYPGTVTDTLIIKTPGSISLGNLTRTYNGSAQAPSVTTTPAGLTVDLVYETPDGPTTTAPTLPGAYTVRGSIRDPAYAGRTTSNSTDLRLFVINKGSATITLGSLSQTWNGSARTPIATTVPAGLTVTYAFTKDGVPAAAIEPGTYAVTATIDSPLYAGTRTGTLTIAKAPATITLGNLTQAYAGSDLVPTVTTVPPGLAVVMSYNGGALTTVQLPGTYSATATINDPHYQGANSSPFTITKMTGQVLLETADLAQTYDGTPRVVRTTTIPPGLAVVLRYNSAENVTNAGTYAVSATLNDPLYQGTSTPANLVVAKLPTTITLDDLAQDFTGGLRPVTTSTIPSGQTVVVTYDGRSTVPSAVGVYAVSATVNTTNHLGTATGSLMVRPVITTISNLFGSVGQAFTATITATGSPTAFGASSLPSWLTVNPSTGALTGTPTTAASVTITLTASRTTTGGTATGSKEVTISVLPSGQQMTWPTPGAVPYGTLLGSSQLNATSTVAGSFSYDPPAGTLLPIGSQTLRTTFTPTDTSTYSTVQQTVTLTVTKAPVTVTVANASRVYGAANPTFTTSVSGLVGTDALASVTPTTTAIATSAAGTYPITATAPSLTSGSASNYTVTVVPGILTVSPAPLTIRAGDATRTYGSANPVFTSTVNGLVGADTISSVSMTTSAGASTPIGPASIIPGTPTFAVGRASNYAITAENGTLTITAAPLTVYLDRTVYRVQGGLDATINPKATGLQGSDRLAGADIAYPAQDVAVGSYPLPLSNARLAVGSLGNYTISYSAGTLVVVDPLSVTIPVITWATPSAVTYGSVLGTSQLNAVADAAGTITYDPPLGALLGAGTQTLVATFTPDNPALVAPATTSVRLEVLPTPLQITALAASRVYGATDPVFTARLTGLQGTDAATTAVTTSTDASTPVGLQVGSLTPTIVQFTVGSLSNYALTTVLGDLQITPANLTITARDATRVVGTDNPEFPCLVTGLVSGDTLEPILATTTATVDSVAGAYALTPSEPRFLTGSAGNYRITLTNGRLAITEAMPVITSALVTGIVGQAVRHQVAVSSTTRWFSASGLPDGLTISSTGLIAGIPSTAGLFLVTVDAQNQAGRGSGTISILITEEAFPVGTSEDSSSTPASCGSGTALVGLIGLLGLALTGRRRRG